MADEEKLSPSEKSHTQDTESLLVIKALGGAPTPLNFLQAHVENTGGEHRPQQEEMVEAVTDAIQTQTPLIVQAGTGTGKSLAYLFPAAVLGGRAVIATATNQLSEQLIRHDLPQVQKTLKSVGKDITFTLLKGRNNYACLEKVDELEKLNSQGGQEEYATQDRLFDNNDEELSQVQILKLQAKKDSATLLRAMDWVKRTSTGDRTDAPSMPERVWSQISTSSADCPGAKLCPFGNECFTELAREKAKTADIIVTNHALLARDMGVDGAISSKLMGVHKTIVIDEAHDFLSTLTDALSKELNPRAINKFLSRASKYLKSESSNEDAGIIASTRNAVGALQDALEEIPQGPILELSDKVVKLIENLAKELMTVAQLLREEGKNAIKSDQMKKSIAITLLADQADKNAGTVSSLRSIGDEQVRWVERDRKDNTPIMFVSPIAVGDYLREAVGERTLIATSATLTVGKDFRPFAHGMGLDSELYKAKTLDVGSPFNYPKQGMLYIPTAPFPEPIGKDRVEHTAAVLETLGELVHAAGGRTLALFTTTNGALNAAEYLRKRFPDLQVHAHGEDSADALVRKFAEEETSVLCVTMGLWQGISVEGAACSLVVIDKVAFAPVDDVLTAARRAHADREGRNGFNEIIVGQAATSLAQGAGRLIRCFDLDTEILTTEGWKKYNEIKPGMFAYGVPTDKMEQDRRGFRATINGAPAVRENQILAVQINKNVEPLMNIKGKSINAMVTPDHSMLIQKKITRIYNTETLLPSGNISLTKDTHHWKSGTIHKTRADELPSRFSVPLAGRILRRPSKVTDDWLWLIGFIYADGHINKEKNRITLHQSTSKPKIVEEIELRLKRLDIKYNRYVQDRLGTSMSMDGEKEYYRNGDMITWQINGADSARIRDLWVNGQRRRYSEKYEFRKKIHGEVQGWKDIPTKDIPRWCLTQLSRNQLIVLLDGLVAGDGTPREKGGGFFTSFLESANRFQEICALVGYRSQLISRRNQYEVHYTKVGSVNLNRKDSVSESEFGETWCVNTELGSVIARRDGKTFIAGNSQSDKGVVAILDPRLLTKSYGRTLIRSLPDFKLSTDLERVTAALTRLTGGLENKGVNHSSIPSQNSHNSTSVKNLNNVPAKPKTTRRAKSTKKIGFH